jgi:hypothetical protein
MNIHNIIYSLFGRVKVLPNYTTYKNTIIINPTHIQIITRNKVYYIRNTETNLTRLSFPVFENFTKIDKINKAQKEVK